MGWSKDHGTAAKVNAEYAKEQGNVAKQEATNLAELKSSVEAATQNASAATENANAVIEDANTAASNADSAASEAIAQANHAKNEGDRAKAEADRLVGTDVSKLDNKITEVTTQLAQTALKEEVNTLASGKADITYVDSNISTLDTKINTQASGSPKGTYTTLEDLQLAFPTGNTNIYVVSADGKWYYWSGTAWLAGGIYQATGIADKTVTVEKATFVEKGRNLFNSSTITVGKTINTTTGAVTDNIATCMSDFIPVKPQTLYARKNLSSVIRYDKNKNFISGVVNGTTSVNTGVAEFVRLVMPLTQVYGQQFQEGEVIVEDKFGLRIVNEVDNAQKVTEIMRKKQVYKRNSDLYTSKNLIKSATSFSASNAVVDDDYEHVWRTEEKAIKITATGLATTGYFQGNYSTPLAEKGISEILVAVYIPNLTNINSVQLQMHMTDGTTWMGSRAKSQLTTGWNILRFVATQSTYGTWTNFDYFRFYLYVSGQATAYIGKITAVMQNKAKIMIVNDHGYSNFKNVAYPQLRALGIPTTWAINPGRLGGTGGILTEAEVDELSLDPYSDINFHAWNPTEKATQFMTADELRTDTLKCMRWIQSKGYQPQHWWRSVFVQNMAENHVALQDMVEAYSTPTGAAGYELYPFINKWNVGRVSLHGRDEAWFDTTFDVLKKTKPLLILYTHDIHETDPIDLPEAQFNYFLSKLTTAVSEGWIEGVTYDQLKNRYSRVMNVDDLADYLDTLN